MRFVLACLCAFVVAAVTSVAAGSLRGAVETGAFADNFAEDLLAPLNGEQQMSPLDIAILRHGVESSMFFDARMKRMTGDAPYSDEPYGTKGVDFAGEISVEELQCFKKNGAKFVVPRAFRSVGQVDPHVQQTIVYARTAGIENIDVYYFPAPHNGTAASQIAEMIVALQDVQFNGMVWVDVEDKKIWGTDYKRNRAFFRDILAALKGTKLHVGIYTAHAQWTALFGDESYVGAQGYPLWYAHYDSHPTFSDFTPFGGWTNPVMKQYLGDKRFGNCEMLVDISIW